MIKRIICYFVGHKKYNPSIFDRYDILRIEGSLGKKLIVINVCERCGAVYSNYPC